MSGSFLDSGIFCGLIGVEPVRALFSDEAMITSMLRVEGELARVQGNLGVIPMASATAIWVASKRIKISPSELSEGTRTAGIPVPALVSVFRDKMDAPEHAAFVHFGATTQDIMDTGLILRLLEVLDHLETALKELLVVFGAKAQEHRSLPMAARTRHQIATPTSFGARIASWGSPFLRHLERLGALRPRLLCVSFAGASGNLSALGADGLRVADALAEGLGLAPQVVPCHAVRDNFAEFVGLLAMISGSLEKFASDMLDLGQSEIREVTGGAGGGSSTMPHKSNPVSAETIVSLSGVAGSALSLMHRAMAHKGERDGAAWALEWQAVPQASLACASALSHGLSLAHSMRPDAEAMMCTIERTNGAMFAEAASFRLAQEMERPKAQELVKAACVKSVQSGQNLREVLTRDIPEIDWEPVFDATQALGAAPEFAERFARAVFGLDNT